MVASELAVISILRMNAGRGMRITGAHVVDVATLFRELEAYQVYQAEVTAADVRLDEQVGRFANEPGLV